MRGGKNVAVGRFDDAAAAERHALPLPDSSGLRQKTRRPVRGVSVAVNTCSSLVGFGDGCDDGGNAVKQKNQDQNRRKNDQGHLPAELCAAPQAAPAAAFWAGRGSSSTMRSLLEQIADFFGKAEPLDVQAARDNRLFPQIAVVFLIQQTAAFLFFGLR